MTGVTLRQKVYPYRHLTCDIIHLTFDIRRWVNWMIIALILCDIGEPHAKKNRVYLGIAQIAICIFCQK